MSSADDPHANEEALLERVRAGDPDAVSELIERHAPRVLRFGIKICRDEEDAREVTQDTLLAAARGLRNFRGSSSISTWLYSIARSFCIKRRTRGAAAQAPHEPLDSELVDRARTPEEQTAGREVERVLEEAIALLEPAYREVLVLRDIEGLSAPEVAQALGVSVEAVKSRLHRARARVRDAVAPLLSPEPALGAPRCPDVVDILSRHTEGDIDPDTCRQMEAHAESCPSCAARCESLRRVLALCRASPAPGLPADVQRALQQSVLDAIEEQAGTP